MASLSHRLHPKTCHTYWVVMLNHLDSSGVSRQETVLWAISHLITLRWRGPKCGYFTILYYTILRNSMQYHAILCKTTQYQATPWRITSVSFFGGSLHISGITTENNKKIFSISSRDVRLCGKIFAFVSKYKTENRKFSFSSWNTRINDVNSRTRLKSWNWHPAAKPFVCWEKLSDDPYGVPSIPQSSPDVHISCQNWRKVGISGLPLQKGRSRMQCVWEPGELRGKIVKKKYECDHI